MKTFFEENLNSMSFTFTIVTLLNAILGMVLEFENVNNKNLIVLALLITVLWAVASLLSKIPFQSERIYHIINLSSTLILFYLIMIFGGFLSLTRDNIMVSGIIYLVIYMINVRRQKREVEKLVTEINKQLSNINKGDG